MTTQQIEFERFLSPWQASDSNDYPRLSKIFSSTEGGSFRFRLQEIGLNYLGDIVWELEHLEPLYWTYCFPTLLHKTLYSCDITWEQDPSQTCKMGVPCSSSIIKWRARCYVTNNKLNGRSTCSQNWSISQSSAQALLKVTCVVYWCVAGHLFKHEMWTEHHWSFIKQRIRWRPSWLLLSPQGQIISTFVAWVMKLRKAYSYSRT